MGLEERSGPGAENKCLQDQAAYIVVKEKEVTGMVRPVKNSGVRVAESLLFSAFLSDYLIKFPGSKLYLTIS